MAAKFEILSLYSRLLKSLDTCLNLHLTNERKVTSLPKPVVYSSPTKSIFPSNYNEQDFAIPEAVLFVEDITGESYIDRKRALVKYQSQSDMIKVIL